MAADSASEAGIWQTLASTSKYVGPDDAVITAMFIAFDSTRSGDVAAMAGYRLDGNWYHGDTCSGDSQQRVALSHVFPDILAIDRPLLGDWICRLFHCGYQLILCININYFDF